MNEDRAGSVSASALPAQVGQERRAYDETFAYFPGPPRFERSNLVERLRSALDGRVTAAYLLGSYARGTAHGDSDIDLIIVAPTTRRWPQRAWDFADLVSTFGAADVLVYTLEEWLKMNADDHPFVATHRNEWVVIR